MEAQTLPYDVNGTGLNVCVNTVTPRTCNFSSNVTGSEEIQCWDSNLQPLIENFLQTLLCIHQESGE